GSDSATISSVHSRRTFMRSLISLFTILIAILALVAVSEEWSLLPQPSNAPRDPPATGKIAAQLVAECLGHEDIVTSVTISPDGKLAVSAGDDQTLRFWSVPDGKPI